MAWPVYIDHAIDGILKMDGCILSRQRPTIFLVRPKIKPGSPNVTSHQRS